MLLVYRSVLDAVNKHTVNLGNGKGLRMWMVMNTEYRFAIRTRVAHHIPPQHPQQQTLRRKHISAKEALYESSEDNFIG